MRIDGFDVRLRNVRQRHGGRAIAVSINGHHVYAYEGKTREQVIEQTRRDIASSLERPEAYTWTRTAEEG